MAITSSAKKAIRVSARKRVYNLRRLRAMRDVIKEIRMLALGKKTKEAMDKLPEAYKAIDKAAKKGIIKKNNASRKKSRLSAFIKRNA